MRTRKVVDVRDLCHHVSNFDIWHDFEAQLIWMLRPAGAATVIVFNETQVRDAITLSTAGPDRVNLMKGFVEALDAFGDDRPMFYLEVT
jgi:hypothetical protein